MTGKALPSRESSRGSGFPSRPSLERAGLAVPMIGLDLQRETGATGRLRFRGGARQEIGNAAVDFRRAAYWILRQVVVDPGGWRWIAGPRSFSVWTPFCSRQSGRHSDGSYSRTEQALRSYDDFGVTRFRGLGFAVVMPVMGLRFRLLPTFSLLTTLVDPDLRRAVLSYKLCVA